MSRLYQKLELELVRFTAEDVLTTSAACEEDDPCAGDDECPKDIIEVCSPVCTADDSCPDDIIFVCSPICTADEYCPDECPGYGCPDDGNADPIIPEDI